MASSPPASLPHRAGGQVRNQSVAPRWRAARRRPRSYTQSGVVQIAGMPPRARPEMAIARDGRLSSLRPLHRSVGPRSMIFAFGPRLRAEAELFRKSRFPTGTSGALCGRVTSHRLRVSP
jgi:hypothetical protein